MRNRSFLLFVLLIPATVLAGQQYDEIQTWLKKMHRAAHTKNYEGVFVYGQRDQLSSMKIIHSTTVDGERERLISMDGSGREVIRNKHNVTCFMPDKKSVVVEKSRPKTQFPPRFPVNIETLLKNYELALDGKGQVAGYPCQKISIRPKDKLRYGYRLWVEEKSGLLLKTHLVNENDAPIEQFMFTQIRFLDKVPEQLLEPQLDSSQFTWFDADQKQHNPAVVSSKTWQVTHLPPGFKADMHRVTMLPTSAMPAEHLIFTDGLATVSVFIEEDMNAKNNLIGGSHMGAVHAFGRTLNDHHVTVVGEVPFRTVQMIGESIKDTDN